MDKEKEREIFNKFIRKIIHFVSDIHLDFSEEEKRIISKYDYDETVLNTVSLVLAKKGEKAFTTDKTKKEIKMLLDEYIKLNRELIRLKNNKDISIKKTKGKAGRTGKFKSEQELHQKILSIPNWKTLSKNKLAKKIGYQSSSGLNQLLDSKKWSLPSHK